VRCLASLVLGQLGQLLNGAAQILPRRIGNLAILRLLARFGIIDVVGRLTGVRQKLFDVLDRLDQVGGVLADNQCSPARTRRCRSGR
jgi:hypothetical protein